MTQPPHESFELVRSESIDALNIVAHEYRHIKTGAVHLHLEADYDENVFLVALRTVPTDSTGVAHILEHTVLCGSEKYPVRDPFFMMIRRSLNTFMNAFTSSDWTAYPFASQNRQDFDNLLSVYLDAVFFANLDPLDFAQEGHRLDFETSHDTSSPLMYKGVVYNEMKGAMSSITSQLWHTLCKHTFTESTYHYNSGGEPDDIPSLSYDGLQSFYKTHYHPSNAVFMTFGDMPACEHQATFEQNVLSRFERSSKTVQVDAEPRLLAPKKVLEYYNCDDDDLSKKTHTVVAWLLGPSTDLKANLEAHLISSLLFDNSASPLQNALETTPLGQSPSPINGLEDSQLDMMFIAGIEGGELEQADDVEALILSVLQQVADDGIDPAHIAASLHQLSLHQREIGGDSYPFGLQLLLNALPGAIHRGDAIGLLDIDQALAHLTHIASQKDFIAHAIKRLFLDNTHRVTLTLAPDASLEKKRQAALTEILAQHKTTLSQEALNAIAEQAVVLEKRQKEQPDDRCLPKVGLEDIPKTITSPLIQTEQLNKQHAIHSSIAGTNGIIYQQAVMPLHDLSLEQLQQLPYLTLCMTEVGLHTDDYLSVQQRQAQQVGAINAFYSIKSTASSRSELSSYLTLSSKALNENSESMIQLMQDTLEGVRFDELSRIKELIAQAYAYKEQSITGNGHVFAMSAASASLSPSAFINQALTGLDALTVLKKMSRLDESALLDFTQQLKTLQKTVLQSPQEWLSIGERQPIDHVKAKIADYLLQKSPSIASLPLSVTAPSSDKRQAWITQSSVHFCATAFATPTTCHSDSAALTVLGGVLRNGYLHRAIREQGGAYGGGASQDNSSGSFRFYSYRDPRMGATLDDFEQSLQWLHSTPLTHSMIEESILGVVSSLDKPGSPAGEVKRAFHNKLSGRTPSVIGDFRQAVTNVTEHDLKRVAETYLTNDKAHTAVITGEHGLKEAESLQLTIKEL